MVVHKQDLKLREEVTHQLEPRVIIMAQQIPPEVIKVAEQKLSTTTLAKVQEISQNKENMVKTDIAPMTTGTCLTIMKEELAEKLTEEEESTLNQIERKVQDLLLKVNTVIIPAVGGEVTVDQLTKIGLNRIIIGDINLLFNLNLQFI